MKRSIIILFMLCVAATGYSQGKAARDIDKFIEETLKRLPVIPGFAIAVVKDNKPVLIQGYGYADREKGIKANASTPFYIASATKSFVGTLAVILENEGKLDLNAPLTSYKPFKNLKNKAVFDDITITDLLRHTSGIENGPLTFRDAYTGDKPREVMVMLLEEATKIRAEGKTYSYANLGYNILDILLEEELGMNWRDLLNEKLFMPLKMKHTTAYISEVEKNKWGLAWPYMAFGKGEVNRADLMKDDSMMQAAGGLVCSAEDVANWLLFNLNSGKLKGKQVYAANLLSKTQNKQIGYEREGQIFTDNGYGLGWISANYGKENVKYHFGGFSGFFSHISFMPDQSIGVAVFANESNFGSRIANTIAAYAYDRMLSEISEGEYEKAVADLENGMARIEMMVAADREKQSKRTWQLERPMTAYEGEYFNKFLGTVKVSIKDGKPVLSLGRLMSTATPFTQKNTMRVELMPGRGEVIRFGLKETGSVAELVYQGEKFERVK